MGHTYRMWVLFSTKMMVSLIGYPLPGKFIFIGPKILDKIEIPEILQ